MTNKVEPSNVNIAQAIQVDLPSISVSENATSADCKALLATLTSEHFSGLKPLKDWKRTSKYSVGPSVWRQFEDKLGHAALVIEHDNLLWVEAVGLKPDIQMLCDEKNRRQSNI